MAIHAGLLSSLELRQHSFDIVGNHGLGKIIGSLVMSHRQIMMIFMMVASNMTLRTSPDHNQTDKAGKQDPPPPPLLLSQPHRIPSPYSFSISTPSSKPPTANHITPHHDAIFVPPIKLHLSSHHLHHETVKLTKAKSEPKFTTLFFQVNRVRHSRHNLHKTIRMLSQWGIMGLWDLKHWTEIPRNHEGFFCCNFKLGLREEGKSRKEPNANRLG